MLTAIATVIPTIGSVSYTHLMCVRDRAKSDPSNGSSDVESNESDAGADYDSIVNELLDGLEKEDVYKRQTLETPFHASGIESYPLTV